ncbi:HD domain-containing protein [Streptomyces sp. 150FB]|uniref:HD domain-containing protein n=1 Tax=Streptomyces sp. 150FB TaxID=1576605 RepID=UPI001F294DDF|nr:HD domain-containing protein [Streptomyces sp. 150FB]
MPHMNLNDLITPDTATSAAALEVASVYQTPALLNHSLRAYVWAAAHGTARGIRFDPELLYVAAVFHDVGLVAAFDSHTVPFEEAGGHVARVFAAGAGWPAERRERLSEVIIRHMWPEVDVSIDPEGYLLARATTTEIVGRNVDDFTPGFRDQVLERYPRLDLTKEFLACFETQAERKPDSSAAGAVRSGLSTRMTANPLDSPRP